MRSALGLIGLLIFLVAGAQTQLEPPNGVLLVAKPGLADPNFSQTVVLASQAADGSTVGVILNRPTRAKHETTGAPLFFGGPVMREVLVALFRSERAPDAAAFHVLNGIYLSMHPRNLEKLFGDPATRSSGYRLFTGFAGWVPGQLQSELARDDWFVLPASAELLFRDDTSGMWEELVRKARGRVAMR
ncbi:MAG TPA: YqgE/AlgH family protein [Burkholderiales bacterium]|nr:YqgE/AlgH family protein [Burkholderiales bacterium]